MKTIINNMGKSIEVPEIMYNALKSECDAGVWCAIIKLDYVIHGIILPDNFP